MFSRKALVSIAVVPIILTSLLLLLVDYRVVQLAADSLPPNPVFLPIFVLGLSSFVLAPVCCYYYVISPEGIASVEKLRPKALVFIAFEFMVFLIFYSLYFFAPRILSFGMASVGLSYLVGSGAPTLLSFVLGFFVEKRHTKTSPTPPVYGEPDLARRIQNHNSD